MNFGSRDLGCSQIQVASMNRYNPSFQLRDSRLPYTNEYIEAVGPRCPLLVRFDQLNLEASAQLYNKNPGRMHGLSSTISG